MKHLKTFESLYKNPIYVELADYVLINFENKLDKRHKLIDYIENNVGQIINIEEQIICIKYDDIPDIYKDDIKFKKYIRFNVNGSISIHKDWILYLSKDKNEIESYLNAKKYNL